jgi:hypothetical protein
MGFKIAPTYWWDGLRWHFAGTTATTKQILVSLSFAMMPAILLNLALALSLWKDRPDWCNPCLLTVLVGLLTALMIYLICWDFEFLPRGKSRQ